MHVKCLKINKFVYFMPQKNIRQTELNKSNEVNIIIHAYI